MSPLVLTFILSLQYLLVYAVYGVILPFAPIILREQGLSDRELSLALTSVGIAACLAPLVLSHIADTRVRPLKLIQLLSVLSAVELPTWLLAKSFPALSAAALLFFCLYLPILSIVDTYVIALLKQREGGDPRYLSFQSTRAWGSLGFMLPSLIFYLTGVAPANTTLIAFACLFCLGGALCASALPHWQPASTPNLTPSAAAIRFVWNKPHLRMIFIGVFVTAVGLGNFYVFFPRYLQELGFSRTEIGLIINFGVLFELALVPLTGGLVRRLGFRRLLLWGVSLLAVRLLLLAWIPLKSVVILSQLTHAPMVVALFIAMPMFLQASAPEGFRFSLQSLYFSLGNGLARIGGPLLMALVLSRSSGLPGLRHVSLASASLVLVGLVLLIACPPPSASDETEMRFS